MKVLIQVTSGFYPRYLADYSSGGDCMQVTSNPNDAALYSHDAALYMLELVKRFYPLAQLSYAVSVGA